MYGNKMLAITKLNPSLLKISRQLATNIPEAYGLMI
jgi:hypothetical protein